MFLEHKLIMTHFVTYGTTNLYHPTRWAELLEMGHVQRVEGNYITNPDLKPQDIAIVWSELGLEEKRLLVAKVFKHYDHGSDDKAESFLELGCFVTQSGHLTERGYNVMADLDFHELGKVMFVLEHAEKLADSDAKDAIIKNAHYIIDGLLEGGA